MNKDFQKNIIPAENQNNGDIFTYGNGAFKVMFVGNSITKHAPKPDVGWTNDCGMAASSIDKDYVHLLIDKIKENYNKDVSYCIVQAANFERDFSPYRVEELYSKIKGYNPNVMIMFFGANVNKEYDYDNNPKYRFGECYEILRNYLSGEKTKVFHSQGFYIRPILDNEKEEVARKYEDVFINLEDIRNREDTHGMFNHPNDLGMYEISERFWQAIENELHNIV